MKSLLTRFVSDQFGVTAIEYGLIAALISVVCIAATLGTIGFEGRFNHAAIGTVSNVASRLCDEPKPGQILISPRALCWRSTRP
jgi:Flp pilus assembly pilin Flp